MNEKENKVEVAEDELDKVVGGAWDGDWDKWEPQPGVPCFKCRKGTLEEDKTSSRPKCICSSCGSTWYYGSGLNWSWFASFIAGMQGP